MRFNNPRTRLINRGKKTMHPKGNEQQPCNAVIFSERFYHPLYLALSVKEHA